MIDPAVKRVERRVVLVASGNALFVEIISEMLIDAGFRSSIWDPNEAPWLAIVRAQPCVIVCDCDSSNLDVQRLVIDATARGIPLLLSRTGDRSRSELGRTSRQRVAWFNFPIPSDAFRCIVESLAAPIPTSVVAAAAVASVETTGAPVLQIKGLGVA
jgi:hypothetical protein